MFRTISKRLRSRGQQSSGLTTDSDGLEKDDEAYVDRDMMRSGGLSSKATSFAATKEAKDMQSKHFSSSSELASPTYENDFSRRSYYHNLSDNQIRLLDLAYDERNAGLIHCAKRTMSLQPTTRFWIERKNRPVYAAVSHTWLDGEYKWYGQRLPAVSQIMINRTIVSVPGRIAYILDHLLRNGVTTIWPDALCINQSDDDDEKGHQVKQMGRIFSCADEVVVILGKPSQDTDDALKCDPEVFRRDGNSTFLGFYQLLNHEYWSRAWVLQEIAGTKRLRIICGKVELSSPRAEQFIRAFAARAVANQDGSTQRHLSIAAIARFAKGERLHVLHLLQLTQNTGCQDHRDALFSKIPLALDPYALDGPDYRSSVNAVFTRFAIRHILSTNSLELLCYTYGSNRNPELPSWVPDWRPGSQVLPVSFSSKDHNVRIQPDAGGTFCNSVPGNCSADELVVSGYIICKLFSHHRNKGCRHDVNAARPCTQVDHYEKSEDFDLYSIEGCSSLIVLRKIPDHFVLVHLEEQREYLRWLSNTTKIIEDNPMMDPQAIAVQRFNIR